jgi:gamma-glutamyl:cysteine ligase YbdK (ATP-grasp superfamily)
MKKVLHLFDAFGIELEYMITARETGAVLPVADNFFLAVCGEHCSDFDTEKISFSNELALHVLELKTNGPAERLDTLPAQFAEQVKFANQTLAEFGAMLMPSAMHPLMNPLTETRLWPHEYNEIYETYNRIFDCRGHGWGNLQSTHINLPFANDQEFAALHTAIRLLLPLMPALAASSPLMEGKFTGLMDSRLDVYSRNQKKVASIIGDLIPEAVFSEQEYREKILQRIYDDVAYLDPDGVISHEWLNSRTAIARFERMAIEIRLLDIQECPVADLAIVSLIVETLRFLVNQESSDMKSQAELSCRELREQLFCCMRDAGRAEISHPAFLEKFGLSNSGVITAGDFWRQMFNYLSGRIPAVFHETLEFILRQGCLADRICLALGERPDNAAILKVYRELCRNLQENTVFSV